MAARRQQELFAAASEVDGDVRETAVEARAGFARVALALPVPVEYSYAIPARLRSDLVLGCRVRVPFRGRRLTGVIVGFDETCDLEAGRVRAIEARLAETPPLPPRLLDFTRAMAEHYCCSWGTALDAAWPASLKSRPAKTVVAVALADDDASLTGLHDSEDAFDEVAGMLALEEKSPKQYRVMRAVRELGSPLSLRVLMKYCGVTKSPVATLVKNGALRWTRIPEESTLLEESLLERAPRHDLSPAQQVAVDAIVRSCPARRFDPFLLFGVTGSGKTEVYLRALERVVAAGRGAIILVPEIALTPQTVGRFRSRFPDVAVLHSSLGDAERARQWLRLARGEAKVVVGTRSAIFAPIDDVGLIIVDEEHETSFKQQSSPRYHARDMALLRGRLDQAIVVLGSATPSLESYHEAREGRIEMLRLEGRAASAKLPRVLTIDMRHEKPVRGQPPLLSQQLIKLVDERVALREQVLFFLNRRGFAPVLYCGACGDTVHCEHCDVPMTWHARRARLICHYCFEERRRPEVCPGCKSAAPIALGSGTERIEDVVRAQWPGLVVARMDSDTMTKKGSYEEVLSAFRRRDIDILIGTQMIAKGLDFPGVTLVGVISADTGIYQPDFRAAERTFSVLSQVAGRAGRGDREGLVVIQTLSPELEPIRRACSLDTTGFLESELRSRAALGYPPFQRLIRVVVEGRDATATRVCATNVAAKLRNCSTSFVVIGPMDAPLARIRERYRQHIVIKCRDAAGLASARDALVRLEGEGDRGTKVIVDVDPQSML